MNILSHTFSIIWILSTETLKTSYFLLWLKPSNNWYVEYLAVFGLHYGRCTLFLAIIKTEKKIISAEITSQASHFAAGKENKPQCTISVSKPFIVDVLFLQWLFNYTIFIYFFTFLQDTHSLLCFHYRAFIQNSHISQQKKKKNHKKNPLPSVPLTHRHSRPCNVGVLGLSGEGGEMRRLLLSDCDYQSLASL